MDDQPADLPTAYSDGQPYCRLGRVVVGGNLVPLWCGSGPGPWRLGNEDHPGPLTLDEADEDHRRPVTDADA
jgi:hypothetical protein